MECPECGQTGTWKSKNTGEMHCNNESCSRKTYAVTNNKTNGKLPKILLFDVETSTMEAWVFSTGKQVIRPDQIKKDWFMLSWSAKWLFDSHVMHERVTGREARARNDKRIVKSLWDLIDESDVICAHNLIRFDKKMANTRFLKHGLNHPSPYKTIDTLQIAKREFRIASNSLNYLCKFLGLNVKEDTGGYKLWLECEAGDEKALKKMDTYCQNDVKILEELYLKLKPYIHSHPNVALYMDTEDTVCSNCGSDNLKWGHIYSTNVNRYQAARCECGAFVRTKAAIKNKINGRGLPR